MSATPRREFVERAKKPAEMVWMMAAGYLAASGVHGNLAHKLGKKFLEFAENDIALALQQTAEEERERIIAYVDSPEFYVKPREQRAKAIRKLGESNG